MSQKIAYVTGGMGGIGTAICQRLAKDGYKVIAGCGPNSPRKDRWIGEQKAIGYDFIPSEGNVADWASTVTAFEKVKADVGRVDILVNNAGITRDTVFRKMSPDDWKAVIDTNLNSLFNVTKQVIDGMVEANWGRIINIASLQSYRAFPNSAPYGAAKGGILQLTRAIAQEWSKYGITCNAIGPGFFPTALTAPVFANPELVQLHASRTAIGRNGKLEDLYGLTIFLASDASAYLTGQTIMLDGGYTSS